MWDKSDLPFVGKLLQRGNRCLYYAHASHPGAANKEIKMMYFVKAVKGDFVAWQGYQKASSAEEAIEFAQMYNSQIAGASWTAEAR